MSAKKIELIGLPGSGKTFIVENFLEKEGFLVLKKPYGFNTKSGVFGFFYGFIKAPYFSFILLLFLIFRKNIGSVNMKYFHIAQQRFLGLKKNNNKINKTILIDEGLLHAIYSMMFGTKKSKVSGFFLNHLVKIASKTICIYIFINTDKNTCIEHFKERDTASRFNFRSNDELIKDFEKDNSYNEIITALNNKTKDKLVIVKNTTEAIDYIDSEY